MALIYSSSALILTVFTLSNLPQQSESGCICSFIYMPVCGSDGTTYANPCLLACAGAKFIPPVHPVHEGICAEDVMEDDPKVLDGKLLPTVIKSCRCPKIYMPVCGTNDKTYSNICELTCVLGVKIKSKGPCEADKPKEIPAVTTVKPEPPAPVVDIPDCPCSKELAPVCGNDGVTYGNKCLLRCKKGVLIQFKGSCETGGRIEAPKQCNCPKVLDPVCGVDGITYPNSCSLQCQGVELQMRGQCFNILQNDKFAPGRVCACPKIYSPVCASNGQTYNNDCIMECQGLGLNFVSHGVCEAPHNENTQKPIAEAEAESDQKDRLAPCICPRYYLPVCGKDEEGKEYTYSNICQLKCKPGTTKVRDGSCENDQDVAVFRSGYKFNPPSPQSRTFDELTPTNGRK